MLPSVNRMPKQEHRGIIYRDEPRTVSNLYDFPAREFGTQGRWASPDPAGLAATDLTRSPILEPLLLCVKQPTNLVDPLGLDGIPCMTAYRPGFCADSGASGRFYFGGAGSIPYAILSLTRKN
jgi:hypothetical protein